MNENYKILGMPGCRCKLTQSDYQHLLTAQLHSVVKPVTLQHYLHQSLCQNSHTLAPKHQRRSNTITGIKQHTVYSNMTKKYKIMINI